MTLGDKIPAHVYRPPGRRAKGSQEAKHGRATQLAVRAIKDRERGISLPPVPWEDNDGGSSDDAE